MALINGVYVFVKEESIDRKMTISEHALESGTNLCDNIRGEPDVLHISGAIVGEDFSDRLYLLCTYMASGIVVRYEGRYVMRNALIQTITTRYLNTVWGGCEFDMTIRGIYVVRNTFEVGMYSGPLRVETTRQNGMKEIQHLEDTHIRFHVMRAGESIWYLAEEYKGYGVTVESIKELNEKRKDIFALGHGGDWNALLPGARLRIGGW